MSKEEIIQQIENYQPVASRNNMGCSEDWYSPVYALSQTFCMDELKQMSESELNNLLKLAGNMSEALY